MAHDDDDFTIGNDSEEYELSGKILLIAVVILFVLVTFILLLNLFARWRIIRAHRREFRRRNRVNLRTQLFFHVNNNPAVVAVPNRGLQPEVLNSLPVFVYDSSMEALECSVCLCVFEDDDKGRILPKCAHSFHAECVDMWFLAHSTCPLCRSKVELIKEPESDRSKMLIEDSEPGDTMGDSGSSSGATTTYAYPRKDMEVSECRRLSFKRLLSMNRKNPLDVTTSYGVEISDNHPMGFEIDLETGFT